MKRFYLALCLFSFITLTAISQPPQYGQASFSVSGKITDANTQSPMEYCTVSLFNAENDSLVNGSVTNDKGTFNLTKLKPGSYYIEASFIGFTAQKTEPFTLNGKTPNHNVGNIKLSTDAKVVDEVEVTAIRSTIKYEIDKKVVNVDKQLAASDGDATDVLATVPSVQVDINGNVKLRGSGEFQVLINGRPSILSGSDALRQIPASQIKNIEIITNPSAKYDAEGTAGILNIILKENKAGGLSGLVGVRAGLWKNYGGNAALSYRAKKVTITATGDFNNRNMPRDFEAERTTNTATSSFLTETNGERIWTFRNFGASAGIEYNPNKNHSVSVKGAWRNWSMLVDDDVTIKNTDLLVDTSNTYRNINDTKRGGPNYQLAADYQFNTKTNGKLYLHAQFNKNNFNEEVLNYSSNEMDVVFAGTRSTENGPGTRLRFNLDYEHSFGEHAKIEIGGVQQLRWNEEDIQSFNLNPSTNEYINQTQFNRTIKTQRHMRAFYGTYSNKWKKLGYKIGVRAEHTDRQIEVAAYNTTIQVKRLDLFPSVHTSYNVNDKNQLFLSYSKRIKRPRPWFLQPNQIFLDPLTIFEGTPDILPTFSHNIEAGWLKRFKKNGSFSTEFYYRRDINVMEFTQLPFRDNIIVMQPQNVGDANTVGIEAKVNYQPKKWWDIDLTGNLYRYSINGNLQGFDFDNARTSWSARLNNYFVIKKNTKFQLEARYQSKEAFSLGETEGFFTLNAGFSQSLLKNALTLGLQARNLAGTVVENQTTTQNNYFLNTINRPKWPNLMASVTYRINNYRPKRSKHQNQEVDY